MTQIIEPEAEVGDIAEAAKQVPADASLYERLGGAYAIAGAVDVLVDRLFANALVNANTATWSRPTTAWPSIQLASMRSRWRSQQH